MYSWFIDLYIPCQVIIYIKHYLYSCSGGSQTVSVFVYSIAFSRHCWLTGSDMEQVHVRKNEDHTPISKSIVCVYKYQLVI